MAGAVGDFVIVDTAADYHVELAVDLIVGPISVRLFFGGAKFTPRLIDAIVDLALSGLRGGGKR